MAEQEQEEQDGYLSLGVDVRFVLFFSLLTSLMQMRPTYVIILVLQSELALALLKNKLGDRRLVSSDGGKVLPQDLPFSSGTREVFQAAQVESRRTGMTFVTPEHILLALIDSPNPYVRLVFNMFKTSDDTLRTEALKRIHQDIQGGFGGARQPAGVGAGQESKDTSGEDTLEEFCRDLCQHAREKKIDPVIGRLKEVNRVAQILARRTKNNPILLGDPGVGKTAIAEGLACAIVDGALPDGSPLPAFLRGKRLLEIDVPLLIAGSKERGELELRVTSIIKACKENGDIILVVDEIHTMVGGGSSSRGSGVAGSSDIGNLFKPALSRGEIVCIGATTLDEHRKYIESDAALERRFQPIIVEEPSDEDTLTILKGVSHLFERHHRCIFSEEAINDAVYLSSRYIADRRMPDKAIDVLDEAGSRVRIMAYKNRSRDETDANYYSPIYEELDQVIDAKDEACKDMLYEEASLLRAREMDLRTRLGGRHHDGALLPVVTQEDIASVISSWTGIPVEGITEEKSKSLFELEDRLKERVIGQDDAIQVASRAVCRAAAGIGHAKRPIATLLFSGPTGVGKTELAKALASQYFAGGVETDASLIRLDMSEYMERHTVSKLIGAPPGFVGYNEGGKLTEAIRRNPHSVVLLDEIEKAHPDVFNLLLQMIEEGRLTDSSGRTVSFSNSLIILTSNIGSSVIAKGTEGGIGFNIGGDDPEAKHNQLRSMVMEDLKAYFRPELLNRLDDIVVFRKLDKDVISQITRKEVEKTITMMLESGMELTITDPVYDRIVQEGFSDENGAREIRRAVIALLDDPISDTLLQLRSEQSDVTHIVAQVSAERPEEIEITPLCSKGNVRPIGKTADVARAQR